MGTKGIKALWDRFLWMKWHQAARLIAVLILLDQWLGPLGGIPSSEGIVVVCLGVLFAPVPTEKTK